MTRQNRIGVVLLALLVGLCGRALANDWLDLVADALGISKTPSQMKGLADRVRSGDLYLAPLDGGPPRQLTSGGGFRSPVFRTDGKALLALRGEDLVQVALDNGETQTLLPLPQARKLLGVDKDDPSKLLLLVEIPSGATDLAVLSLSTRNLIPLPHDRTSPDQRRLLAHLEGEARDYGGVRLYTRTESRRSLGGFEEWSDVYVQQDNAAAVNVSNCEGDDCLQPALAPDRSRIGFVRSVR